MRVFPHVSPCNFLYGSLSAATLSSGHAGAGGRFASQHKITFAILRGELHVSFAWHDADPKRAGLLLYGLQVASANAEKLSISRSAVRSVTFTEEGTPLAPQDYGYDTEDYEDDEDEEDED